jgi:hypothetical protein
VLDFRDSSGALITTNDDWMTNTTANRTIITSTGLAPTFDKESVVVFTLPPSTNGTSYTAIVSGSTKNGADSSGIGLVEAYFLP